MQTTTTRSPHRARTSIAAAAAFLLGLLAGCGEFGDVNAPLHKVEVGPGGGALANGPASLTIPKGALPEATEVEIKVATNAPGGGFGSAYDLLPDGLTFDEPVTLRLSYEADALPENVDPATLVVAVAVKGAWEVVPGSEVDTEARVVSAPLHHFSLYTIFTPCDDGDPCTEDVLDLVKGCRHLPAPDAEGCDQVVCEDDSDCPERSCFLATCEEGVCAYAEEESCQTVDTDADGDPDDTDCAPEDAAIHSSAAEICDGLDNDCDGDVDEDDACAAGLTVKPATLSFGNVKTGTCKEMEVEIRNTGAEAVTVAAVELGEGCSPPFAIAGAGDETTTVEPDHTWLLTVSFCPVAEAAHECSIELSSDDPEAPALSVKIQGTGVAGALDTDGDGDPDDSDCAAEDASIHSSAPEICDGIDNDCDGVVDEGFIDSDGDTIADCCDADRDGDGIENDNDNCIDVFNPDQANQDADALGNSCDPDIDGDGHLNEQDCAPNDRTIHTAAPEVCDGLDNDCDGVVDEEHGCDDGDACTADACVNGECINTPDPGCGGPPCTDDSDCISEDPCSPGYCMNGVCRYETFECDDGNPCTVDTCAHGQCTHTPDPSQQDTDADGVPDPCDADDDDDGIPDAEDNCPFVPNPGQQDTDGDGAGDACE